MSWNSGDHRFSRRWIDRRNSELLRTSGYMVSETQPFSERDILCNASVTRVSRSRTRSVNPNKPRIRQAGGRIAVSSAQTRGKPVFDDAELDFDAFSTIRNCFDSQLAIMPSQEAIFSVWKPYLLWWSPDHLENPSENDGFSVDHLGDKTWR